MDTTNARQQDLFNHGPPETTLLPKNGATQVRPLAYRARPELFEEFYGHRDLFERFPNFKKGETSSLIIYGPSGSGKTTLAKLLANQSDKDFYSFNAVLGGVNELKKLISSSEEMKTRLGRSSLIFIDEIHRFNKSQQDALLPYVEAGDFVLIGATTENPRRSINNALLSRLQLIELAPLEKSDIENILLRAIKKFSLSLSQKYLEFIASSSHGDARLALNSLEALTRYSKNSNELSFGEVKKIILNNAREYDRSGDRHYDVISAFIKSMRGTDPSSAILWLAVMIDGGEDPVFIARRLVIFASEDIGNADPQALPLAVACLVAVQNIGMPEARLNLAQATTYLASAQKSNASYTAINQALEYVQNKSTIDVPLHLKNFPPKEAKKYLYPHAQKENFIKQDYSPEKTPQFYQPTEQGIEQKIKTRLENLWRS